MSEQQERPDPREVSIEALLDTLEASDGLLVAVFNGVGISTYYWYNPGRDGFEQIESLNRPEKSDGGVVIAQEVDSYGIYSREILSETLEAHFHTLLKGATIGFVRYPDSPFPEMGQPEDWGGLDG
jgi:hypothetical protein